MILKILNVKFVVLVVTDQIIEMYTDADYTAEVNDIKLGFVVKLAIIKNVFVYNPNQDQNIPILFPYF